MWRLHPRLSKRFPPAPARVLHNPGGSLPGPCGLSVSPSRDGPESRRHGQRGWLRSWRVGTGGLTWTRVPRPPPGAAGALPSVREPAAPPGARRRHQHIPASELAPGGHGFLPARRWSNLRLLSLSNLQPLVAGSDDLKGFPKGSSLA